MLSNRYGVGFEAVLTARDTLTFYPWFVVGESTGTHDLFGDYQGGGPNDYTDYDVQTRAGGLDLQYRRYLGSSVGAQGVFMAPGFEVAHYITNGTACSYTGDPQVGTCGSEPRQEWTYLAPSLDVGGQAVLPVGLTVGASLGAHYRVVVGSLDDSIMPWGWRVSHGPGAEPRLRVWVGWAF